MARLKTPTNHSRSGPGRTRGPDLGTEFVEEVFTKGHFVRTTGTGINSAAVNQVTGSASAYIGRLRDIQPRRIAADAAGNIYIAGNVRFPLQPGGPWFTRDVFVTKLDASLSEIYTIYFGGDGHDVVTDLAIGSSGDIYLVGGTRSENFPVLHAFQPQLRGGSDGFVCRLTPDGGFVYSTYLGGEYEDSIAAIAVNEQGNAYVTGSTSQGGFPVTENAIKKTGDGGIGIPSDAFVTKLSADGQTLIYSTRLGGTHSGCAGGSRCVSASSLDGGRAIAIDGSGNAYVTGSTNSPDFPTTAGAFQNACRCGREEVVGFVSSLDAFVSKIDPLGETLLFSTFLGAEPFHDRATGIALDAAQNVYVTGSTSSPAFPTTAGALQTDFDVATVDVRSPTAFVAKLTPSGSRLVYSTFLTGQAGDTIGGIAVDALGQAYITGQTNSRRFPVTEAAFPVGLGFLTKLHPNGSEVLHSTRLPTGSAGAHLTVTANGDLYLLGPAGFVSRIDTETLELPNFLGVASAAGSAISAVITTLELVSIFGNAIGPSESFGLQFDSDGQVATILGGTQVLFDGLPAPLTYAGPNRINAIVPLRRFRAGESVNLEVLRDERRVVRRRLSAFAAKPSVFRNATETALLMTNLPAAALNADGTVHSLENRAKGGSIVSIFATGLGRMTLPVSVWSNRPLDILFVGQAPGLVDGVVQINFRLPQVRFLGSWPLTLRAGDITSDPFTIFVAP